MTKQINIPVLTRVEGEGALKIEIDNNHIKQLQLNIFEPPRYFEGLLQGKNFTEVPDITARICGICPVAYQVTSAQAFEQAFHCQPNRWIKQQRKLIYYGEWIQSHALHIHLLAAPDFSGFNNVIEMAAKYPEEVNRGLALQALGNKIISFCGGRSVHPIGVKVGGFFHSPETGKAKELLEACLQLLPAAKELLLWTTRLKLPESKQKLCSVALHNPHEYAINTGELHTSEGDKIPVNEYENYFSEFQQQHSTALYSQYQNQAYLVGPLARMNLNYQQLPEQILHILKQAKIHFPSKNMFHSIIARAAELYYALLQSIQILQGYRYSSEPDTTIQPQATSAISCTEAPRGILWHQYQCDSKGSILQAQIVPPTSQNQWQMENDLRQQLQQFGFNRDEREIKRYAEMLIRNYDPCISCATHFLDLTIERNE